MRNNTLSSDFRMYVLHSGNSINKLIAINVSIYLFMLLVGLIGFFFQIEFGYTHSFFYKYLGFPKDPIKLLFMPYTFFTYQFIHSGFFHILLNMLFLLFFGRILRDFIGDRKFLVNYLLGGVAGALLYFIAFNTIPIFMNTNPGGMVGASGAVMATVLAAATLVPNYSVRLIIIGNVKLVYIAIVFVLIDLFSIPRSNAGGHLAHIGGAIFGFAYIKSLQNGKDIGQWFSKIIDSVIQITTRTKKRPELNTQKVYRQYMVKSTVSNTKRQYENVSVEISQEVVDEILDKISAKGYQSLSAKEKDILDRASKEL
jgi:membrane associated rhomboid family serine protease